MTSAFRETKNLFANFTGYKEPLTYSQWMNIHDDDKAAVLFVQFYEQITLAWHKTKSFFVLEEDGVETVIQYLMKNVPVIKQDPSRFTPNYIYRVASNCLYCISHDIQRDIERWEKEVSNIVVTDNDEVDLFDLVVDETDNGDLMCEKMTDSKFWDMIEDLDIKTKKVIDDLLNGTGIRAQKLRTMEIKPTHTAAEIKERSEINRIREANNKVEEHKKMMEVTVSKAERDRILEELEVILEPFIDVYYI